MKEEAVKGNLESPFAKVSGTVSVNREDEGGQKPPQVRLSPDKNHVYVSMKAKIKIDEDAVSKLVKQFSKDGKTKWSSVPAENYQAFLKGLEKIKEMSSDELSPKSRNS